MSGVGTWRRFWALPAGDRGLVMEAVRALFVTRVGMRVMGFRRWRERVESVAAHRGRAMGYASSLEMAGAIAGAEAAAARHLFFTPNCLVQSLALMGMLRRRGMKPELRMGARKEGGAFEAHAWVELDGVALNDAGGKHAHFVPFEEMAASAENTAAAAAGTRGR